MPARAATLALALLAILCPPASAFHDGGVSSCTGCHLLHPSPDNPTGHEHLLLAETASEVCLACHADAQGAVFGSNPLAPPPEKGAGNFVFLLEDNINDGPDGATNPLGGHAAGHSIIVPSRGLGPDPQWPWSPGGDYPSERLGCTSCHDPHGNDHYRMLRGNGPLPSGDYFFAQDAPLAEGLALDGIAEETPGLHAAYLSGMSAWCANCHEDYWTGQHDGMGGSPFRHPTDRPMSNEAYHYNAYNGTADPQGGTQATAYLPQVPFESSSGGTTSTAGPHPSNPMHCLSCHRAHASSGPRSGRWDFYVTTLGEDGLASGSWPLPNPYGDPAQRPLCEKCHEIDAGDADGENAEWEEGRRNWR